jgi:2-oxoglutarate ferredoxin oxidoreductase subunit alpha
MVHTRSEHVARIARDIPKLEVNGPSSGDLLVLGWGSTYGSITQAVNQVRARGLKVASAHLRHLNPFPANLGEVLASYRKVLIPELNLGQLSLLVRARFLVDAIGLNKIQGKPFKVSEIVHKIEEVLGVTPTVAVHRETSSGAEGMAGG